MQSHYDVVILGGGPAGLAAAISIRERLKLSVLVVERQDFSSERVGENCPPQTILLLKQLGVAREFYRDGHQTCPGYASVWGRSSVGYNDFIVNPMGPSWRLNRARFDRMLAQRAQALGAELITSTRFLECEPSVDSLQPHRLHLLPRQSETALSISAGFVIDASGFKAVFAQALGIHKQVDDELFATVRFAEVRNGHSSQQVHLEAIPQGWCYHTALPEQRLVSMMVTEKELLPALREDEYQGFESALRNTSFIGPRLQQLELENPRYQIFPIRSGRLPVVEGDNWMAIGDAALSFDPVSAQGIYKALSQGLAVADKVEQWSLEQRTDRSFSALIDQHYAMYRTNRAHVYSLERRWPQATFWLGRQGLR